MTKIPHLEWYFCLINKMFSAIQHIDELVLHFIHVSCGNAYLDILMPYLRNPFIWSPFYLFLLVFMLKNYGSKGALWLMFFFFTFVFCDFISASLIKPLVQRLRPCHQQSLSFIIRELIPCGSGFSFPSSHATNHFGLAFYMIITLQRGFKLVKPLVLSWAFIICYAQLYVCVHYPSDIVAGAALGSCLGWFFGTYYNRRFAALTEMTTSWSKHNITLATFLYFNNKYFFCSLNILHLQL